MNNSNDSDSKDVLVKIGKVLTIFPGVDNKSTHSLVQVLRLGEI